MLSNLDILVIVADTLTQIVFAIAAAIVVFPQTFGGGQPRIQLIKEGAVSVGRVLAVSILLHMLADINSLKLRFDALDYVAIHMPVAAAITARNERAEHAGD